MWQNNTIQYNHLSWNDNIAPWKNYNKTKWLSQM